LIWIVCRPKAEASQKALNFVPFGAQGYLHEYYSQRASQRANYARRICGDKEIKFAEAFQRITPTILKGL
jgi:4-oxalomesaconate hydratase